MKIRYKIQEVLPRVFAIIVPDQYDRGMLFVRTAEFYESPNPKFRNKHFSFFDYMKWYTEQKGAFSYSEDWSGFNIPLKVARKANSDKNCLDAPAICETPYDEIFQRILKEIQGEDGYIIGTESVDGQIFSHEMAHALFYTNPAYKKKMKKLVKNLPGRILENLENVLSDMGYCKQVRDDEIQAYCATGLHDNMDDVDLDEKPFQKVFEEFSQNLLTA